MQRPAGPCARCGGTVFDESNAMPTGKIYTDHLGCEVCTRCVCERCSRQRIVEHHEDSFERWRSCHPSCDALALDEGFAAWATIVGRGLTRFSERAQTVTIADDLISKRPARAVPLAGRERDVADALPPVVERFARLRHPRAGALFRSGSTHAGPYVAFHAVAGTPLGLWCRRHPPAARVAAVAGLARLYDEVAAVVGPWCFEPEQLLVGPAPASEALLADVGRVEVGGALGGRLEGFGANRLSTPAEARRLQLEAPERLNLGELGPRTVVWTFGVLLFGLLADRWPFAGSTTMQVLRAMVREHQPIPALREVEPSVPAGLSDVVARCLQRDPAERLASPTALADALGPWRG